MRPIKSITFLILLLISTILFPLSSFSKTINDAVSDVNGAEEEISGKETPVYSITTNIPFVDVVANYLRENQKIVDENTQNKMDKYGLITGNTVILLRNYLTVKDFDSYRNVVDKVAEETYSQLALTSDTAVLEPILSVQPSGTTVKYYRNMTMQNRTKVALEGLREVVRSEDVDEIENYSKRIVELYRQLGDFCGELDDVEHRTIAPDPTPDIWTYRRYHFCACCCGPHHCCWCFYVFIFTMVQYYRPVASSILEQTYLLMKEHREQRKILCAQYLTELATMRAQLARITEMHSKLSADEVGMY